MFYNHLTHGKEQNSSINNIPLNSKHVSLRLVEKPVFSIGNCMFSVHLGLLGTFFKYRYPFSVQNVLKTDLKEIPIFALYCEKGKLSMVSS